MPLLNAKNPYLLLITQEKYLLAKLVFYIFIMYLGLPHIIAQLIILIFLIYSNFNFFYNLTLFFVG